MKEMITSTSNAQVRQLAQLQKKARERTQKDVFIVEGINVVKKHMKPNQMNQNGGIVELNAPIHVSNVKKVETSEKPKKAKKD